MNNTKSFREDHSEDVSYTCSDYPIYISSGMLSDCPNYRFPGHWHDDIELIAVLDGEIDYNVNGEVIHLTQGEGIVVNSKQMHFGFSDNEVECSFICLLLHPILLCNNTAYEKNFVNPIINDSCLSYIFLSKDNSWHRKIYDTILYIKKTEKEKTAPLKVQAAFLYIWSLIYENTDFSKCGNYDSMNLNIVKNMVGFINSNCQEQISLKDVAASGGVGESKCCKLFRRYLNITPNGYIQQCRFDKSIKLLLETDMSVTEIANIVGFNSSSYFAESFKKKYRITPHEYRKRG